MSKAPVGSQAWADSYDMDRSNRVEPTSPVTAEDRSDNVRRAVYEGTDSNDKLFDIVCTIGSVYRGGSFSARVAAFMLIAEHNADGEFSFPDEDGSLVQVGVYTAKPDNAPNQ